MVFTTWTFATFMLVVFIGYYILPKKVQWIWLLIGSVVFYGFSNPLYLIFLFGSVFISYAGALNLERNTTKQNEMLALEGEKMTDKEKTDFRNSVLRKQKWIIAIVCFFLLGMLAVFKYSNFILQNTQDLLKLFGLIFELPASQLILPLGLSFYIFQNLAYCVDIYRKKYAPEHNFFRHLLVISYFPHIMQGPIGNYEKLSKQLKEEHDFCYPKAVSGLLRCCWGLFKKLVLANRLSALTAGIWNGASGYQGFVFWMITAFLYAFELYADFSGYMDIALGCSKILGIQLDENFDTPYLAQSIPDFWKRWHITLSRFFRDYLYIPLGGNRVSKIRYIFNVMIVWMASGLWHGAGWNYVLWGAYYGILVILSTMFHLETAPFNNEKKRSAKGAQMIKTIVTFILVLFGYLLFRPADLQTTGIILTNMRYVSTQSLSDLYEGNQLQILIISIALMALIISDLIQKTLKTDPEKKPKWFEKIFVQWSAIVILLVLCVFMGSFSSQAFIYLGF